MLTKEQKEKIKLSYAKEMHDQYLEDMKKDIKKLEKYCHCKNRFVAIMANIISHEIAINEWESNMETLEEKEK